MPGDKDNFLFNNRFNARIAGFKDGNLITRWTYLYIEIKLLKEKRMTGIVSRKSQMKSISSVASYYIRILPIPKTPNMNIPACWFFREKLADDSRNQSKTKDY
jgi:hypothetical protein